MLETLKRFSVTFLKLKFFFFNLTVVSEEIMETSENKPNKPNIL